MREVGPQKALHAETCEELRTLYAMHLPPRGHASCRMGRRDLWRRHLRRRSEAFRRGEKPNDLRACFSFLKRHLTAADVATMLMASGSLEIQGLDSDAEMVLRTMEEIRGLLRVKATPEIRRLAGL